MIATAFQLHIERIEPARNMARFYSLSIEPSLFGIALVRRWGRIGCPGRQRIEPMANEREAIACFLELARSKRERGYRPAGPRNFAGTD